jgi:hypothetical protein
VFTRPLGCHEAEQDNWHNAPPPERATGLQESLSFCVAYATNETVRYEKQGADRNWTLAQWVRLEQSTSPSAKRSKTASLQIVEIE